MAGLTAQTTSLMGCLLFLAIVRTPATDERAQPLAVASRSNLGLVPPSPAKAIDPLAPLPKVMASQALAFCSSPEPWSLSFDPLLHVAGPPLHQALAEPMFSRR